ncbi:MAG: YgiQ family radical SAM protein [Clostridia bacterium]|nr:YgiQ family radical SAM protein [Clostridia bacterium]
MNRFLPVSAREITERGWDYYDFLYILGDAYVDHPSFGPAVISRCLEAAGYRVAILAQPPWQKADAVRAFPRPRLGVLISGGNIDSMVAHYTAAKKPRSEDLYSPGGKAGYRPDRCTIVYANLVREVFGDIPIIIGGIEASLRRFAHYDYWDNRVRRSILLDSRANIISYGMGEHSVVEIANELAKGTDIKDITNIRGTVYLTSKPPKDAIILPSFETIRDNKREYAIAAKTEYLEQDPIRGKTLAQPHLNKCIVQNPPAMPLTREEMDAVYNLPYTREYHPMYEDMGGIPAINEVRFSITSARGCFGNCNFCALSFHQGRIVQSRSQQSIVKEAENMVSHPEFKGYIHDVGGPTANFRYPGCSKQLKSGACRDRQCLFPTPCKNLQVDHTEYLKLLRTLRKIKGVKKVFIRSGIRFDYLMADKNDDFFRELCMHHISGQLKVAPEHVSDRVLKHMGKPSSDVYKRFSKKYYDINKKIGKEQYLVPYLMSSHPGSSLADAIELALFLKGNNLRPQQVQDFYPTPATISTAMFYTGLDPLTLQPVYVPRDAHEKAMQRALLQYTKPQNYDLVYEALTKAGRTDLIGFSNKCLIRPRKEKKDVSKNFRRKDGFKKNKR